MFLEKSYGDGHFLAWPGQAGEAPAQEEQENPLGGARYRHWVRS